MISAPALPQTVRDLGHHVVEADHVGEAPERRIGNGKSDDGPNSCKYCVSTLPGVVSGSSPQTSAHWFLR